MAEKKKQGESIADMREIARFWSEILRDDEAELKDKLKVSELLAKAQGGAAPKDSEKEPFDCSRLSLKEKGEILKRIRESGNADEKS